MEEKFCAKIKKESKSEERKLCVNNGTRFLSLFFFFFFVCVCVWEREREKLSWGNKNAQWKSLSSEEDNFETKRLKREFSIHCVN